SNAMADRTDRPLDAADGLIHRGIGMELVEREPELATLRDLFTESLGGQGRVVAIRGPVASGKTTLLRTFAEHAIEKGAVFLDAPAFLSDSEVPFGVVRRISPTGASVFGGDEAVGRLLDKGVGTATFDEETPRGVAVAQAMAPVLRELGGILLDRAARAPLL